MSDPRERLIDEYVAKNAARILRELEALCAQPSISAQGVGMQETAGQVAQSLRARGFRVEIMPTPGYPVIVAEAVGRSPKTLLLYNHYDVQPPEPLAGWTSPPFQPTLRDGKLYARGAVDDKGHIVCRLAAIDAVRAAYGELPCGIKFIIEGEEEISSPHLASFIHQHAQRLRADACLWEFGDVDYDGLPVAYLGLRGILYVELSVQTGAMDAHSGIGGSIFPNAAWRLTWALASLKNRDERVRIPGFYDHVVPPTERDLQLLAELPEVAGRYQMSYGLGGFLKGLSGGVELRREAVFSPTCTICGLTAGYQGPGSKTVLPAQASAKLDFRLVPDMDPEDVLGKLRAHLAAEGFADIEVRRLGAERPGRTDTQHPFVKLVAEAARDVYGQPQRIWPMSGGSGPNAVFIEELGVPISSAGVGYPDSRIHAPNENVVLDHFYKGIRHTARVMARFGATIG